MTYPFKENTLFKGINATTKDIIKGVFFHLIYKKKLVK